jgi:diacylglycerol kinase family enzyme
MVYLINPRSGSGLGLKLLAGRIAGTTISIDPPRISEQIQKYVSPGDRLVVAGGDGTFSLVIGTLFRLGLAEEVSLYMFPIGTGNDLARSLRIKKLKYLPQSPADWGFRFPHSLEIPVWRFGHQHFVNYLSLGMDAKMLAEVEGFRKLFPGNLALRKIGLTLASIQHIDYYIRSRSNLRIDSREYELRGKAGIIISNMPYYMGGSRINRIKPQDPRLSITFIHHAADLIRLGLARNNRKKKPVLPYLISDELELCGPDLPMQIDGEVGIYRETRIELAGSIKVWVPAKRP